MTQGEWKHGTYIPAPEENHQTWKVERGLSHRICLSANCVCKCCSRNADQDRGRMHFRNGNKRDLDLANLIWLCDYCYSQVNRSKIDEAAEATIIKLRAELT
jgi:hypothetical protein